MDKVIQELVEQYPNNFDLGEAIRTLYWKEKNGEV